MSNRGPKSAAALFRPIERLLERVLSAPVPGRFLVLYSIAVAAAPLVLISTLGPAWSVPVVTILSIWLLYRTMTPIQARLFEYSRSDIQWFVTVPFYWFFIGWGGLAVLADRPEQIGQTVGSFLLLGIVSIWPIFRRNKNFDVKERKIPFENVYTVVAALVLIQQGFLLWRFI